MKNLKLISILLAAGAIAACNKTLDENQPDSGTTPVYNGNKGYVNISLNLPTTSGNSTRANDNFDNGLAAEYNVNSAIIALFYGADENSATCTWAFELSSNDFQVNSNPNNITSYFASGVRMIQAPAEGQNVYALAIINPTSSFTVSGNVPDENAGNAVLSTQLQVDGTPFTGLLSALNVVANYDASIASTGNNGNFLMTNAPVSNKASFQTTAPEGFNVTTLAPIDVYTDKSLASGAASANPIYVERAVAKATVKVNSNDGILIVDSEVPAFNEAKVTFDGWVLQNTNKTYFPIHKVDNVWTGYFNGTLSDEYNRFYSRTLSAPYRVYWAIDNNYSSEAAAGNFNVFTNENQPGSWNSVGNNSTAEYSGNYVGYCAENTTIAQQMSNDQLTSVLLKSTFTPSGASDGDNFFMLNNTSEIYTEDNFIAWATAILANSSYALTAVQSLAIKESAAEGKTITDKDGVKALLEIKISDSDPIELSDNQATTLITAAGNNIKFYKDGVTYYNTVVIAHFGNGQTPLTNTDINAVTDYDEAKHLGRYGMVRNNWYELVINSVSGPGEPEIPEIPDTPVDQTSSYINCQINILSWAKRSQGVDL